MYKNYIKRLLDAIISSIAIIVLCPIMGLLAVMVRVNVGKPIFFKQERTGKNQKKFFIVKFRTMTNETDSQGKILPDHNRVTNIGKFLRSTSLDELPELFNIFVGDMSIIGPRPLPSKYDRYYKKSELGRFEVRGGLIPPDAVDINPVISWDEQLKYEVNYAKNCSFLSDVHILFSAFRIVFKRSKENYGSFERMPLSEEREVMENISYDRNK